MRTDGPEGSYRSIKGEAYEVDQFAGCRRGQGSRSIRQQIEADRYPLEIFDNLARSIGNGISRRQTFKLTLSSLAGLALAELGIKTAWAAGTCLCQGLTYDPLTACCTASGVQQKHPLTSVAACPNKVPHPGYVSSQTAGAK